MRILPGRPDHDRRRVAQEQPSSDGCRHRSHDGRQPVPVRVVCAHPCRRQASSGTCRRRHACKRRPVMRRPAKPSSPVMDRRSFIKAGTLAGGGLLVGTYLGFGNSTAWAETSAAAAGPFTPNAFITITPGGAISIIAPNSEMGQGIRTSLPMIVAEELDVPWKQVTVVQGDLNPAYGRQMSVGSMSTPTNFTPLRHAGATARAMLIEAAAQTWGVPAG